MLDKKKLIINEAVKLFGTKGYHATSVQEIAERCGMAKGSFYNYFKSKEELVVSIFKYYVNEYREVFAEIEARTDLDGREKLIKQMKFQINQLEMHSDWIKMMLREQMMYINEELDQFLQHVHYLSLKRSNERIAEIYPDLPAQFIPDCTIILDSLFNGYISFLFLKPDSLDQSRIPSYILNRMDAVVRGLQETDEPLLKAGFYHEFLRETSLSEEAVLDLIEEAAENAEKAEKGEKAAESLRMLKTEFSKQEPNAVILESLLLFLEQQAQRHSFLRMLTVKLRKVLNQKELS
ncbi:TetR/AcrR family transcriptional regulator [Bacillus massiliglaciei]|uniref:TetR/AcrR family transcriptional regulator n=1 Tax=Bacillus massiliglaciei TaxID=1816693 RepID=UPI000B1947D5|nr:TetR/AcrR family transcriptional regulator [Bacillus massiliglaciei]